MKEHDWFSGVEEGEHHSAKHWKAVRDSTQVVWTHMWKSQVSGIFFHNIGNYSSILLPSTCTGFMLQVKKSKSIHPEHRRRLFLERKSGFPQLYLHLPSENFWIDFIATQGYLWLESVCVRELTSNCITFICAWDFRQWGENKLKKDFEEFS